VTAAAASNIYGASPLPNPSTLNIGSTANPVINVVQGDYTLSGGTAGSGILLVTGNLTFSGNPTYDGLILVIDKVRSRKMAAATEPSTAHCWLPICSMAQATPFPWVPAVTRLAEHHVERWRLPPTFITIAAGSITAHDRFRSGPFRTAELIY